MLHLSDGGHFENYGLLPLLKLRLPRILVADGSHIISDDHYAEEIIQIMKHARAILGCSFTAMDGGDVLTDIRNKYVHPEDGMYPRMYEFKVRYSDKGRFSECFVTRCFSIFRLFNIKYPDLGDAQG